jgi:hypothetical protein
VERGDQGREGGEEGLTCPAAGGVFSARVVGGLRRSRERANSVRRSVPLRFLRFQAVNEGGSSVLREVNFARERAGLGICLRFQAQILSAPKQPNLTPEYQIRRFPAQLCASKHSHRTFGSTRNFKILSNQYSSTEIRSLRTCGRHPQSCLIALCVTVF